MQCHGHNHTDVGNARQWPTCKRFGRAGGKSFGMRLLTPPVLPSSKRWFPCTFGLSLDAPRCIPDETSVRLLPIAINKSSFHRKRFVRANYFFIFLFYFSIHILGSPSPSVFFFFLRSLDSIGQRPTPFAALFSCLTPFQAPTASS